MPRRTAPPEFLPRAEAALASGQLSTARDLLLAELDRRGAADPVCFLAAAVIRAQAAAQFAPEADALATALDRLLSAVERQDGQLHRLHHLLESAL